MDDIDAFQVESQSIVDTWQDSLGDNGMDEYNRTLHLVYNESDKITQKEKIAQFIQTCVPGRDVAYIVTSVMHDDALVQ
ncbi:MAG TPA: hypothetical protein PK014_12020 [Thermoanaerobaculia bacterium]|nr:hypothetical protein [Thermoanaerobaculia bacterium]HUM28792.1 hypothetical protein [Thermoanaerobaculia bacterium]HXK69049.1 hypothetical protein [Thermoanaerobaculia bacterium]